eukprot:m.254573 g.254573  ORF g.254573 m.254573 type:complete len:202 (+) comp16173_c0_seq17:818-1423(+)
MRWKRGVKYWQPPLEFYKYIIENFHKNAPVVICTEVHGAADGYVGGSPVVEKLLEWRKSIQFPDADLVQDVGIMLGAKYLVLSHSSFSENLAIMSPNVQRVYMPRVVQTPSKGATLTEECCGCKSQVTFKKNWGCGAQFGWPQKGKDDVQFVEVVLPYYDVSRYDWRFNFTDVSYQMLNYDGKHICSRTWPDEFKKYPKPK